MSAIPDGAPDTEGRRERLVALCRGLPEAAPDRLRKKPRVGRSKR